MDELPISDFDGKEVIKSIKYTRTLISPYKSQKKMKGLNIRHVSRFFLYNQRDFKVSLKRGILQKF